MQSPKFSLEEQARINELFRDIDAKRIGTFAEVPPTIEPINSLKCKSIFSIAEQARINELFRDIAAKRIVTGTFAEIPPAIKLIQSLKDKSIPVNKKEIRYISLIQSYETPTNPDMAVLMTYFNPANSVRILQNFLQVRHYLQQANIPLYTGEVAFDESPFLLNDAAIQLRTSSYMFYKENLIKLVEARVPSTFTKLCILDADIMFEQADWYDVVSHTLDKVQVCQPFTKTTFLNINFTESHSKGSCLESSDGHAGHAWAFQRAWYQAANLMDQTVIGGSDLLFTELLNLNETKTRIIDFYKESLSLSPVPSATTASCPLSIVHLYHGESKNRTTDAAAITLQIVFRRESRKILADVLERRADGLLEWAPDVKQQCNAALHKYFVSRADDEVDTILFKKMYPVSYEVPTRKDMAIIIPFFTINQSIRQIQNIITMTHFLEIAKIPYFIAEMAFNANPFLFHKENNIFHFRSESYMFYTENLVRNVEPCIPSEFTKVCIMEPDILFGEPDWYSTISTTLDRVVVTQPFKRASLLALNYTTVCEKNNCLDNPSHIPTDYVHETAGMVWAFNRNWFQQQYRFSNEAMTEWYTFYVNKCQLDMTRESYDSCELSIYQLNSGMVNKPLINRIKTNTVTDTFFSRNDNILEWSPSHKYKMNRMLRNYSIDEHVTIPMQKTVIQAWVSTCTKEKLEDPDWIQNAGLGDLVRGSIGLYKLCKQKGYNFIVDISLHPLSKFLCQKEHKYSSIVQTQKNAIVGVFHKNLENYITKELKTKDYVLCHNISWLDTFDIPADEDLKLFIREILKPNKEFQEVLYSKMMTLPFSTYNIVHFRLGDDELVHNKTAEEYSKYISLFDSIKCDIPNTLLLSDSSTLKNVLYTKYKIFSLTHDIAHVGMHSDTSGIQNTLVEFFLLTKAKAIESFTKYFWISGFARIATYIYDVPLTPHTNV